MAKNKVRKASQPDHEKDIKAFNPTKSKVGRIIIVILAAGMFLGMLIAAVINMIQVLNG